MGCGGTGASMQHRRQESLVPLLWVPDEPIDPAVNLGPSAVAQVLHDRLRSLAGGDGLGPGDQPVLLSRMTQTDRPDTMFVVSVSI
jgi:hypothetical protein